MHKWMKHICYHSIYLLATTLSDFSKDFILCVGMFVFVDISAPFAFLVSTEAGRGYQSPLTGVTDSWNPVCKC